MSVGAARRQQRLAQIGRHDHETEAQRRKQRLAEAADIDHASVGVEAVQARDRPRPVAELAVVVVFDDPRAGGVRPFQQRQPARSGSSARRAGTDATASRRPGVRRARARCRRRRRDPCSSTARGRCGRPAPAQRAARAGIARFLEPGLVAWIEQQMAHEFEAALSAGDDEDLIGVHARAARAPAHARRSPLASRGKPAASL